MAIDLTGLDFGPKMQACSERERKFVWAYTMNGGNGADAARQAGYSDVGEGCKVRAHDLLQRERVLSALDEVGLQMFRSLRIPAIVARRKLIDSPDHPDHEKAVDKTLAALGHGPRTTVDVNHSGEIAVNHTDQALSDLRMLVAIGAPREKLVEAFGHSGLERYERMLAVADARSKTIEGTAQEVGSALSNESSGG